MSLSRQAAQAAIHADLGRAEWRSTPAIIAAIADRLELPLLVVRRSAGDMVPRWEQRFLAGKRRYEALETYNHRPLVLCLAALLHLRTQGPGDRP